MSTSVEGWNDFTNPTTTTTTRLEISLASHSRLVTIIPTALLLDALEDEAKASRNYLRDWSASLYGEDTLDAEHGYMTEMPQPSDVDLGIIAAQALELGVVTPPVPTSSGGSSEGPFTVPQTATSNVPTTALGTQASPATTSATSPPEPAEPARQTYTSPPATNDFNDGSAVSLQALTLALCLGVGLPLMILLLSCAFLCWRRKRRLGYIFPPIDRWNGRHDPHTTEPEAMDKSGRTLSSGCRDAEATGPLSGAASGLRRPELNADSEALGSRTSLSVRYSSVCRLERLRDE